MQSPEWQLCSVTLTEDPLTGAKLEEKTNYVSICATDSPDELLLFWQVNNVQEDSFQLNLRRKTKRVPTNFFLNDAEINYVKRLCPIDNNYV